MAILQSVLQRLSLTSLFMAPKRQTKSATKPVHRLDSTLSRYAPLFALQESRQIIEVVSERTGDSYQSMILGVDLVNQTIELDELFPQPENFVYQPGDKFTFKHHQGGQILSFTSPLSSILMSLDMPVYTLQLPERVSYCQRRQSLRLILSKQQPLTVQLQSPRRSPWYATASNISSGGMRVVVGGNVIDDLARNTLLPNCQFYFNDDFHIQCQARVKAYRFSRRPYRRTEISLEFVDMAPQTQHQLQQLIHTYSEPLKAA